MGKKKKAKKAKKAWGKIVFGILFVISCFVAMYILVEYHDNMMYVGGAAALLLLFAFLFLSSVFSDLAKYTPQEEEFSGDLGEFQNKVLNYMKAMDENQKELLAAINNQNTLLQNQIENLEHEIYLLSEKQVNQAKSIIKYNKENARQLAISERETLEYVMQELKDAIENIGAVVPAERSAEAEEDFTMPAFAEELVMPEEAEPEEELPVLEEPASEEIPAAEEEFEIPELPDDLDLAALFDIPELSEEAETSAEEIPVAEAAAEEPVEEAAPAADPFVGLSSDPNAMMTPEDIAKLLEAMGQ